MNLFTAKDFKVFAIPDFAARMAAIRANIQPRLASIGAALSPRLSGLVDVPLHVHVAKHMRRTVNSPDDTWAAFGRDARGYKKDVHFRVSVSGQSVRLLFEAGPEYYAKDEWVRHWNRMFPSIVKDLQSMPGLGWFRDEHEDEPAMELAAMRPAEFRALAKELTRRKDGQFVLGRRIADREFLKLNSDQFEKLAIATFTPLAPLFAIHEPRMRILRAS